MLPQTIEKSTSPSDQTVEDSALFENMSAVELRHRNNIYYEQLKIG